MSELSGSQWRHEEEKMSEIVAVFETLLYFPSCHYCFSHSKQELYDLQNNREMGVRVLFCEYLRPFFVLFVIFPLGEKT